MKTKVWQGIFNDVGDFWIGYTQPSRWQVYNKQLSRPFRETNYEPEAMLVFNTNYHRSAAGTVACWVSASITSPTGAVIRCGRDRQASIDRPHQRVDREQAIAQTASP